MRAAEPDGHVPGARGPALPADGNLPSGRSRTVAKLPTQLYGRKTLKLGAGNAAAYDDGNVEDTRQLATPRETCAQAKRGFGCSWGQGSFPNTLSETASVPAWNSHPPAQRVPDLQEFPVPQLRDLHNSPEICSQHLRGP